MNNRRGVALIVVLWVIAAAGASAAVGVRAVRLSVAAGTYRIARTRARWLGTGTLALARARLERTLAGGDRDAWWFVGTLPALDARDASPAPRCEVEVEVPVGEVVDLNSTGRDALAALPGFGDEAVGRVLEMRQRGARLSDVYSLALQLSPPARRQLEAAYGELQGRVVFEPPAYEVTARCLESGFAISSVRERWTRAGARVPVVAREVL